MARHRLHAKRGPEKPTHKMISVRLPIEMVDWLEEEARSASESSEYGARVTLSDVVRQAVRLLQQREK